jgi:hypothetical protein
VHPSAGDLRRTLIPALVAAGLAAVAAGLAPACAPEVQSQALGLAADIFAVTVDLGAGLGQ